MRWNIRRSVSFMACAIAVVLQELMYYCVGVVVTGSRISEKPRCYAAVKSARYDITRCILVLAS